MKRLKVTGKELALLCGMAALGTLTLPLGAAARTVDSVTATAGSTAEIVYSGETLTVTNGVESIGNNATGIRAVDDTEVAIGKDIYVHGANSQYNNSYGVYGDSGVQVKVGTDIVVESDAGAERVRGIYIDGGYGSSISSTPDIQVGGNISASGINTIGIYVSGKNANIKVDGNVTASNRNATGITTGGTSKIYVGGDVISSYDNNGTLSYGISVGAGNDSYVEVAGNIVASGKLTSGVRMGGSGTNKQIKVGKSVVAGGESSKGIDTNGDGVSAYVAGDVTANGKSSLGIIVQNDAQVTVDGNLKASGEGAKGVELRDGSSVTVGKNIEVSGTDAVGIKLGSGTETTIDSWNLNVADISAGAGIELGNNSKLELKNVASQAAADGVLLRAAGTATVNVDGSSHLVGDVLHDGTVSGTLALAFAEGSSLTGKVNEQGAGVINLEMDNAVWKLSGDSSLHQLTLNNGAAVHLTHSGGYHTLTAQELQGSGGLFKLDVDVRSLESDKLAITDASSGSHVLDIYQKDAYEPSAGSTEGHGLVLGSVTGTADFTAKDREGSLFYKHYELGSKASETAGYDTDWYLDKIISVDPGDKTTTTVKTIMGAAALNYHTWRTDNDQLLQRLGDLRQSGDDENGVWLRLKGTKISRNGRFSFENKYTTYELGYDKVLRQTDDYTRYGGVAFSYGDGSSSYAGGSGSNHNKAIGLYGTQINKKGHYLDLVLKYSDMDNDFSVLDTEGKKISGDYDNKGLAFSAEYGRKNALQRGWYIEPQAQLTLGYLDGGSYFTSNRVKVEQSHIKSVLGRVGFQLGRDIDAKTNIYIKADLLHEFGGGYDVKMTAANGDSLYQSADFDDTWVEYGIGAAIRTGHNNHLYFDVERTAGSDFKKDWQWNIGARWEF